MSNKLMLKKGIFLNTKSQIRNNVFVYEICFKMLITNHELYKYYSHNNQYRFIEWG